MVRGGCTFLIATTKHITSTVFHGLARITQRGLHNVIRYFWPKRKGLTTEPNICFWVEICLTLGLEVTPSFSDRSRACIGLSNLINELIYYRNEVRPTAKPSGSRKTSRKKSGYRSLLRSPLYVQFNKCWIEPCVYEGRKILLSILRATILMLKCDTFCHPHSTTTRAPSIV